jgi:hypothetical protein
MAMYNYGVPVMEINTDKSGGASDSFYLRNLTQEIQRNELTQTQPATVQVKEKSRSDVIKSSIDLQKELLAIVDASKEKKAQQVAREQIEQGYLDIKV